MKRLIAFIGKTPLPAYKIFALFSITLLFSACVTQSPILDTADGEGWRARGKFSFSSTETRESGNFDWRQNGDIYQVRLFGPLGFGAVQIEGDSQQVDIRSAKEQRSSQDPDNLIYQMTGMHLPLSEIPSWLMGKPSSFHSEHTQFDSQGNLSQTFVHGWRINYEEYSHDSGLPGRISAEQEGSSLTLIVLDWDR